MLRRKLYPVILVALLAMVYVVMGCAPGQKVLETPEDKSVFFMSYYLTQKKDYEKRVAEAKPGTEGYELEYKILKAKRRFLTEASMPIKIYDGYVMDGRVPTAAMEKAVFDAIDRLEEELAK